MKLSETLKEYHECGDFGEALEGLSERAKELEDRIENLPSDDTASIREYVTNLPEGVKI